MKFLLPAALAALLTFPRPVFADEPQIVETLVRELRAVNPDRRAKAAEGLGELGPQAAPAVRSLASALADPNRRVQIGAVLALGQIGPEARGAVPDLIRILKDEESDLHAAAIAALASIGHDAGDAAGVLMKILEDEDEELATSAGLALAHILPAESDKLRPVIPILVRSLKSKDKDVRSDAIAGLGAAGRLALPALIRLVRGQASDSASAWQAAVALQALGPLSEPALSVLVDALRSDDELVVVHAAGALGAIGAGAAPAAPDLQKLLVHKNAAIRVHAASALGDLGPAAEAAVGALAAALADAEEGVRRESAEALGKIGPAARAAIPSLVKLLDDNAGTVTMHAAWALGRIGPDAVPELIRVLQEEKKLQDLVVVVLGDIGEAAHPATGILAELLADPDLDPDFGREIMVTLAHIGPQAGEAIPVLLKILENKEHPLRAGAAYALAKLGARQAVPLLIQALPEQNDADLRVVAPIALVLLFPDNDIYVRLALPRLIELLADDSKLVRHEAANALARAGQRAAPAVPVLAAGLLDSDPAIRTDYLETLGAIGPAAIEALSSITKALADADLSVRCSASYAVGKIGTAARETIPLLEKNLRGSDALLQTASAWALVHVNPRGRDLADRCFEPLLRALRLSDPRSRGQAAEALGLMGPAARSAGPALEELLHDRDATVRESAAEAIKKIGR